MDLLTPARKWAIAEQQRPVGETADFDEPFGKRMPLPQHITMFLSTVGPIAGLIAAIVLLWHKGPAIVGWPQVIAMVVMYAIGGYGTTIGFHRLLTHRAFDTYRPLRLMWAIFGSIAAGVARLVGTDRHRIVAAANAWLDDPPALRPSTLYGDGLAATRIASALCGEPMPPFIPGQVTPPPRSASPPQWIQPIS